MLNPWLGHIFKIILVVVLHVLNFYLKVTDLLFLNMAPACWVWDIKLLTYIILFNRIILYQEACVASLALWCLLEVVHMYHLRKFNL